jgi:PAS domain S-box-containing protein
MKKARSIGKDFASLRKDAEANLREKGTDFPAPLPPDPAKLIHELQVAQIELQMQNDELRRAHLEIEASRDRFVDLYDFAPVGHLTLDLRGLIVEVNLTGAELLGETRVALIKTTFHRFIEQDCRPEFHLFCRRLFQSGVRQSCELKLVKKDGTPFHARLEAIAGSHAVGTPMQYRMSLSDITHCKRAEEEITKLNKALTDRAAELEVTNRELDAFSYSVAHDLRSPLSRIRRLAQIVLEDFGAGMAAEAKDYLQRVVEGSGRMEELTECLLNLSRLGRKLVVTRRTPLNPLVEEVLNQLKTETESRTICWEIGRLPEVNCDPKLMKIVFANLLSNAVKYTRTRDRAVIRVDKDSRAGRPVVLIRDNGVGFDMKYVERLFGVFQRLHREEEFEGTGVGLATVRRIIHKHGGRVWAEAEPDKGATFYFTFGDSPTNQSGTTW